MVLDSFHKLPNTNMNFKILGIITTNYFILT